MKLRQTNLLAYKQGKIPYLIQFLTDLYKLIVAVFIIIKKKKKKNQVGCVTMEGCILKVVESNIATKQ